MADFETFLNAIQSEDLERVKILFRKEFINQISKGWTALHYASGYNNKGDIVKYLVSKGCNMEDEARGVYGGWKCIHISARRGAVEVLKTIIEGGCDHDSLTERGETASEIMKNIASKIVLGEGTKECIEILKIAKKEKEVRDFLLLLKENSLSKIMDPQTGETLLDKLLSNKDPRIMEAIKSKKVSDKEIDEWRDFDLRTVYAQSYRLLQECMLERCLYQGYENGVFDLYSADFVNKDSLFMGPTFLETSVDCDVSAFCLKIILQKVFKVDESWQRAEDIATKKDNMRNKKIISKRREYLSNKEKEGYSRLEIAVWENDPELIEYIMNNQSVKDNEGLQEGGAALSMSYYIEHMECTESLQKNKVNVNSFDKLKHSPLHIAIYKRRQEYSDYLVDNVKHIEVTDFMNFIVLERSVMNDCKDICERLVKKKARCDKYVEIDSKWLTMDPDLTMILHNVPHLYMTKYETIYTLCYKVNKTLYPGLLGTIDRRTVDLTDGDGNTLLHLCAISLDLGLCSALICKAAKVDVRNKFHHTPLLELLIQNYNSKMNKIKEGMIETVKVLIDEGASLNVKDTNGYGVFRIATKYHNEKLLMTLIHNKKSLECIQKSDFLAWLYKKHYTLMKEVIPFITKSLLFQWITKDIIESCINYSDLILAKSLYDRARSVEQTKVIERFLQKSAINGDIELFNEMIIHEISDKTTLDEGESLLSCLIKGRQKEFIVQAINSRNGIYLLEKVNREGKLPLQVCIECEYWEVIDRLITDTTSVNNEDNEGNTPLSLLLTKISENDDNEAINSLMAYVKTLILNSADIYRVNKHDKTVITHCTKAPLKLHIESFFRRHQRRPHVPQMEAGPSTAQTNQQQQPGATTIPTCQICEDEPKNCALNCGHMFCETCAEKEIYCYICRRPITDIIKLYQ